MVHQLQAREEEQADKNSRYRVLMEQASDGIAVYDMEGNIVEANSKACEMMGYSLDEVMGLNLADLICEEDLTQAPLRFDDLSKGQTVLSERLLRHKNGSVVPVEASAKMLINGGGVQVIIRDITERRMLQQQLAYQAYHDALTGLPNRALFMDRLPQALARSTRRSEFVAVLFLDLDDFKVINDSVGHKAGDQMLVEVGSRLQASVRGGDSVARLGGDEFTILLEDVADLDEVTATAQRIEDRLSLPFYLDGHEVFVTTSIGIVTSISGAETPEEMLRNADVAMYEVKGKGKAGYAVFDQSMNTKAWARLQMKIDLRRAIEREEFKVYYQPVVRLDTGQIAEVEALVRWDHPERSLIAPMEFIPLAEETGLILQIGQWVLEQGCRQVKAWQQQHPLEVPLVLSVNLSARQFKHHRLVEEIAKALSNSGLDPCCLKLEITESAAMEGVEAAMAMLRELKDLGIKLAIDDFGTGYSALGYLKRYTVDTLKLDRSFIKGLGQDTEDTAIVRAVLAFAEALKLSVTAEGIETAEQYKYLQALDCELGQGFYFSKPLPPGEMESMLANASEPYVQQKADLAVAECVA